MKKQNRKQGFTLVELLVVIAILAILATVSIVGYTAFIKKAHESNALAEANQIKEVIRAELIAGNDFVIGNVTNGEGESATTTTYAIRLNDEGNYVVMSKTGESEYAAITAEATLTTCFETLNGGDLADLVKDGHATITAAADGLSLTYHYAEDSIDVEIDFNADTAKVK